LRTRCSESVGKIQISALGFVPECFRDPNCVQFLMGNDDGEVDQVAIPRGWLVPVSAIARVHRAHLVGDLFRQWVQHELGQRVAAGKLDDRSWVDPFDWFGEAPDLFDRSEGVARASALIRVSTPFRKAAALW
jgi:hypothetical protein